MGNKKLNIRRILKKADKSVHFFYSEFDGVVCLDELNSSEIDDKLMSFLRYETAEKVHFTATGRRYPDNPGLGLVSLWPSQYMQEWKKMLWNHNDLLASDGPEVQIKHFVFFQAWADNYYTSFIGLELIQKAPFFELELKKFETCGFKRVSLDRATEILSFMTTGFSNSELAASATRFVKYRDIFNSLLRKRFSLPVSSGIKALENLTKKALMTEKYVRDDVPVRGRIYYFEDVDNPSISYIAEFDNLSIDKTKAFFRDVIICQDNKKNSFLGIVKTY